MNIIKGILTAMGQMVVGILFVLSILVFGLGVPCYVLAQWCSWSMDTYEMNRWVSFTVAMTFLLVYYSTLLYGVTRFQSNEKTTTRTTTI